MSLTPTPYDNGYNEAMQLMLEANDVSVTAAVTFEQSDVATDYEHLDTDGPLTRELVEAARRFDGLVNGLGVSPEIALARRLIGSALASVRATAEGYDRCNSS